MKKFFFSVLTILVFQTVMSQDIKKVRAGYEKKDWAKAKEAVDLYTTSEKGVGDWEGWYYKGLIYAQVAKDAVLSASVTDAWDQSLNAYIKANELNSKQLTLFMLSSNVPIYEDNYKSIYNEGVIAYKNQNYRGAFNKFSNLNKVSEFIFKNGFGLTELDTNVVYFAAEFARISDLPDEAVFYFQKIADKEISGEGFVECYRFLTEYFQKKGNSDLAMKYEKSGRKLYPKDLFYDRLEIQRELKKGVSPELFKKIENLLEKEPNDFELNLFYADNLVSWMYEGNKATQPDNDRYFQKLVESLTKCIKLDSTKIDPFILLGATYFYQAVIIEKDYNAIKGKSTADENNKKVIKGKMDNIMKLAIPPFENAVKLFEKLSNEDFAYERSLKSQYKQTLYNLTQAFSFLGDTKSVEYYEEQLQKIAERFKNL